MELFSRQEYWSCHFLLLGIFQGLSLYLLSLLHWQADSLPLYHLDYQLLSPLFLTFHLATSLPPYTRLSIEHRHRPTRSHGQNLSSHTPLPPVQITHYPFIRVRIHLPIQETGDEGLISGSGRSPGGGNGNPIQYSSLGNPMDRGAWGAIVQGVVRVKHD